MNNTIGDPAWNGISIKPLLNPEVPLFKLNNIDGSNIRQSYENPLKNISLGTLNTISSKKSMRSQHRRRRKSKEEIPQPPSQKKRKESRLFKMSLGGPQIKFNLNQTGIFGNQNSIKTGKLPVWVKPMENKAKFINDSLILPMNYKNEIPQISFNSNNTIETARATNRKEKDQIMLTMRPNIEESKIMNSARTGRQVKLKTNGKRASNHNRYQIYEQIEEENNEPKSCSRNRQKRQVPNINTSLVINRNNIKKNFFQKQDEKEIIEEIDETQVNNKVLHSKKFIELKPKDHIINTFRPTAKKPTSNKDSQPEVKTLPIVLNESQSEAISSKQKNYAVRTLDVNAGPKINVNAINEVNKTITQLKSWRSPNNESASTNPQAPKTVQSEKPEFPLGAGKALKLYMNKLSDYEKGEILDYRQVYFLGLESKKVKASSLISPNFGYDNDKGDYKTVMKDHIAYRYEVLEFLGKGSFGQAIKCFDHKNNEYVWLKIIRNQEKFQYQASVEVKVLQHIKDMDPDDTTNLIKMRDYFVFRSHVCIIFELLSMNLYEFIKNTDFRGVSMGLIRRFAIQLLHSLKFIKEQEIIHWDLKPENILLKTPTKSGIKIIDFGSSWFSDEIVYTYIQSRFYRAPEIMLGIPYIYAIDMWSFGCIIAELHWGLPLFPGESEREQMSLLMEILGVPNDAVIAKSPYRHKFFDKQNKPYIMDDIKGEKKVPNSKPLPLMIEWDDEHFLDFVERCLDWDPDTRITPDEALKHVWILEGLPKNVLYHHWKMYDIPDEEVRFVWISKL